MSDPYPDWINCANWRCDNRIHVDDIDHVTGFDPYCAACWESYLPELVADFVAEMAECMDWPTPRSEVACLLTRL